MIFLKLIKIFNIHQLIIFNLILIQFCIGNNINNLFNNKINITKENKLNNEYINTKILKYNSENGLLKQYINNGLFNCGTKYIAMLQKLNKFIENIHREFILCKNQQLDKATSSKFSEQFQLINDLFGIK
ncbi:hypothetical protein Mgra_00000476 [Meloidogyne graminicola]|uniref:Uncharacterized protein n=1 Tax=Meloidogyne graminicola TaxID=189291 RepID=A0A8T0A1S1_9BILA|nr:hypothetical protein Mgra_00000476 [Meloidogyne graminicola]